MKRIKLNKWIIILWILAIMVFLLICDNVFAQAPPPRSRIWMLFRRQPPPDLTPDNRKVRVQVEWTDYGKKRTIEFYTILKDLR